MFPRPKVEGKPVTDPARAIARAIARGPIQLSGYERRPPPRWRFYPWAVAALTVWTLALLFLSLTSGGPACDRLSSLPWLECRR